MIWGTFVKAACDKAAYSAELISLKWTVLACFLSSTVTLLMGPNCLK